MSNITDHFNHVQVHKFQSKEPSFVRPYVKWSYYSETAAAAISWFNITGHDWSWSQFLVNLTGQKNMTMVMTVRNPAANNKILKFLDYEVSRFGVS